ncbi:hypothetical protein [Rhizobium bangladeshense]|uniref:hypothetical protein n=1 Tax=Rhizobium bangladeshense TaxID=1138189 RepID=UPI0012E87FC3|nr:hypothetical protein [Rhizobium bangladeshense]
MTLEVLRQGETVFRPSLIMVYFRLTCALQGCCGAAKWSAAQIKSAWFFCNNLPSPTMVIHDDFERLQ